MNRALAVTLAVCTLLGIATTAFAQEEPVPLPTGSGTVTMELVDQSFDLAPNGTIALRYRLLGDLDTVAEIAPVIPTTTTSTAPPPDEPAATDVANGTDEAPAEPIPVTLTARVLNYPALTDPAELMGLVGPEPDLGGLPFPTDGVDIVGIRSSIEVVSPTEAILELAVPTDTEISVADRLEFNNDGIHPIVVQIRANDRVVASHGTVVERRSGGSATPPTIDLSWFGAASDPGPTGSDVEVAEAVDVFAGFVEDTDELTAGITLAIPPSVVNAAVTSGEVDADDPDLLDDDVILAAPATPFDVSSAVAVGRVDAFTRQLRVGEDEVTEAIGQTPSREIWSTTTELSAPGAQALRDLGVRYLAMPPEIYRSSIADDASADIPAIDRFIELPLPDGSVIPVLVLDEEIGADLTAARTEEIVAAMTPVEWAVGTIADLRLGQYAAPADERDAARSHLIATPDLGPFDPRLASELERFSSTTDAIGFTLASNLMSNTGTVTTDSDPRLPDVAGPSLEGRLQRIGEVSDQLGPVASMLPAGDGRPIRWVQLLDSFVSTAFDDDTVDAELDDLIDEVRAIRDGVVAPDPFTFTLTGREGEINVRVGNELEEPVDVVVRVTSPRLEFPDGDVEVTLAPEDVTVVKVPVVARSNGTSPVTVEILTPSLDPLTEPVTLTSRFTALTGLGQVLTAGLLLILLTWWFSHWRARRRKVASGSASPEPESAPDSMSPSHPTVPDTTIEPDSATTPDTSRPAAD